MWSEYENLLTLVDGYPIVILINSSSTQTLAKEEQG